MKTFGKIFSTLLIGMYITTSSYAALEVVTCDSDPSYVANSCDQCFSGWVVSQGDNKGLLTDVWENIGSGPQVLFKEEQDLPRIVSLGGSSWTEVTASDSVDFWQFTDDLDNLYDDDNLGYVLQAGESATWIESTLGSAYQLVSNPVPAGENVGILIYDTVTHQIDDEWTPALESDSHRECVLYTSGTAAEQPTVVVPQAPRLPETGPEHLILALVALMLGFGFLKFRNK